MAALQEIRCHGDKTHRMANFFTKRITDPSKGKAIQERSFARRMPTLKKKAMELQTLCDVSVFMVCVAPDGSIKTWPENAEEVKDAIEFYKGLHPKRKRERNLMGLLENDKQKLVLKGQKLMKKKLDELTRDLSNQIDRLSEDALLDLMKKLEFKLEMIKVLMLLNKDEEQEEINDQVMETERDSNPASAGPIFACPTNQENYGLKETDMEAVGDHGDSNIGFGFGNNCVKNDSSFMTLPMMECPTGVPGI